MKKFKFLGVGLLTCAMMAILPACDKESSGNNPEPDPSTGEVVADNEYGTLGDNMVATGNTRALSYTQVVLLGRVDFNKLNDTHTYGIVYMEEVPVIEGHKPFDYNLNLKYNEPDVIDEEIHATNNGKFEKQLVSLLPATTYYYRSYIKIGGNYNYAEVKKFTTLDPAPSINMVTSDAEEICALSSVFVGKVNIGTLNNGLDQQEIIDQEYGFIYSDSPLLSTPETLTMEYWENWDQTHFDTEIKPDEPKAILTRDNMNTAIRDVVEGLIPATTYYYRSVFVWNGKFFYGPTIVKFTTLGPGSLPIGTLKPEDLTYNAATLKGTIPFNKVGVDRINGGFMISKTYSNKSEFVITDNMSQWPSSADISYVPCSIDDINFSAPISRLEPNTEYNICAFAQIGHEKDTYDKYGNIIKGKPIYIYGDVLKFKTPEKTADISFRTSTENWDQQTGGSWICSNMSEGSTSRLSIQVSPLKKGQLSLNLKDFASYDDQVKVYYCESITTLPYSGTMIDELKGDESKTIKAPETDSPFTVIVEFVKNAPDYSHSAYIEVSNIKFE